MAFYAPQYKELLSANISPTAKLLYLQLESWYSYCHKNNKHCTVYFSQLCKSLSLDINEIVEACRQLELNEFASVCPENNSVYVTGVYTIKE
ncbi:helix-turn-helix domain-containing protein [Escherichia coli]|nr:helix-turn-helix domain-containing protein [Escherichia coli]